MGAYRDGPHSRWFTPVRFNGNKTFDDLARSACSTVLKENIAHAPSGDCVGWGVPFAIGNVLAARDSTLSADWPRVKARWLVFMHTTDIDPIEWNKDGLLTASRGYGRLAEHIADYVFRYADGSEAVCAIRRRHQIGMLSRQCWGENCFQSVVHHKAVPLRPPHEQQPPMPPWMSWGQAQTRVAGCYNYRWINWLWAWENPHPEKAIAGLRIEPRTGLTIVSAISAGNITSNPLRWETRRKAVLTLPKDAAFDPRLDEDGVLSQIQLDLGQVISAQPRRIYPNDAWADGYNNQMPKIAEREILVEYTAHPDAEFHLPGGKRVPMSRAELIVNGEIRESRAMKKWNDAGHWSVRVDRSLWVALLVRGHYDDRPEIVAAHSSPVMVEVEGSPFFAAADAVTILDQIEGALAYLDTTGTRADDTAYKRMRLILMSAHRELHNRLHARGQYHEHTPVTDHKEHHAHVRLKHH